jgi:hypothetical protein
MPNLPDRQNPASPEDKTSKDAPPWLKALIIASVDGVIAWAVWENAYRILYALMDQGVRGMRLYDAIHDLSLSLDIPAPNIAALLTLAVTGYVGGVVLWISTSKQN